jgi:hypothetical protein
MTYRAYPNPDRALRQLDRHGRTLTAVPLAELSTVDLCAIATSRMGGPTAEEILEISRRLNLAIQGMGALFERMRLRAALPTPVVGPTP